MLKSADQYAEGILVEVSKTAAINKEDYGKLREYTAQIIVQSWYQERNALRGNINQGFDGLSHYDQDGKIMINLDDTVRVVEES